MCVGGGEPGTGGEGRGGEEGGEGEGEVDGMGCRAG